LPLETISAETGFFYVQHWCTVRRWQTRRPKIALRRELKLIIFQARSDDEAMSSMITTNIDNNKNTFLILYFAVYSFTEAMVEVHSASVCFEPLHNLFEFDRQYRKICLTFCKLFALCVIDDSFFIYQRM
jgi:hypothetical protein